MKVAHPRVLPGTLVVGYLPIPGHPEPSQPPFFPPSLSQTPRGRDGAESGRVIAGHTHSLPVRAGESCTGWRESSDPKSEPSGEPIWVSVLLDCGASALPTTDSLWPGRGPGAPPDSGWRQLRGHAPVSGRLACRQASRRTRSMGW